MMPYMTTHSVTSFDHDAIYDNDGILGLVPNLCSIFSTGSEMISGYSSSSIQSLVVPPPSQFAPF